MVLRSAALWAALVILLPGRVHAQSSPGSLADLKAKYEKTMERTIRRYDAELKDLFPMYLKALDALEAELQSRGDLQGVLAVKKEKADAQSARSIPDQDEAGLYQAVAKLREQHRGQNRKTLIAQGKAMTDLLEKYRGMLDAMEKQFTKEGRIAEAVETRAENERVRDCKEARKAAFILAVEGASSDKPAEGKDAATPPPANGPKVKTASLMGSTVIAAFSYSDEETRSQPVELINRYIGATFPRGIRLRLNAPGLNAQLAPNAEGGTPRYNTPYIPVRPPRGVRGKFFNLTNVTAMDLLKMICAGCGMGYRIDNASGEVVVVEDASPDAEWTALTTPPEQLATEMQAPDARNKYAGRTVLVTGELENTARSAADLFAVLNNKVRLRFPKTGDGSADGAGLESALNEAEKTNRDNPRVEQFVEVTAMGEVAKSTAVRQLTLDKVRVMECYSGVRRSGAAPAQGRGGIRGFDGPNRRIRRIGE